ncbi:MAG: prohibitin family protein [bacterium]|nr:prohibitin family protein [bacterium]
MREEQDLGDLWRSYSSQFSVPPRRKLALWLAALLALPVLIVVFNAFVVVEAGERAVIFSKVSGVRESQLGEGLHLNVPVLWEPSVYDVKTMTYTMSAQAREGQIQGDDSLLSLTSDGLPVRLDVSVRFHVSPEEVWMLHQEIGQDYIDKIVRPVTRSVIRMVLSRFTVTEVYSGERQMIIEQVRELLDPKFAAAHLVLDEVLLRDVKFSDQFQQAIEQKQVAQQEAKRMVFVLDQAKLERQRKIVEAEGEAGAIRLRARALARNPQLVQYEYVRNLPAGVKTVIADTNTIINFSDLFTRQQPRQ